MAFIPPRVPTPEDLLCEKCGYVLNGLPPQGRCPECGTPIISSADPPRAAPAWETGPNAGRLAGFISTSTAVIFTPSRFYRTLNVRGPLTTARRFADIHWMIASLVFAAAVVVHVMSSPLLNLRPYRVWVMPMTQRQWLQFLQNEWRSLSIMAAITILLAGIIWLALASVTRLAARLSSWEAGYRGLRLPYPVVLRSLYFHSAHYVPVAAGAAITVIGYQLLLGLMWIGPESLTRYLYVLCIEVIAFAGFLFHTYWIGMRNTMYANR